MKIWKKKVSADLDNENAEQLRGRLRKVLELLSGAAEINEKTKRDMSAEDWAECCGRLMAIIDMAETDAGSSIVSEEVDDEEHARRIEYYRSLRRKCSSGVSR